MHCYKRSDAVLWKIIFSQIWYFFLKVSVEKKYVMHEHTWHDEPISVKLFFLLLLPKKAPETQVCVSRKTNKGKSLSLIIKFGKMIALCEDASHMYY